MRGATVRASAVARATFSDTVRRPGVLLAVLGVGALLLVLHDLSQSAFDPSGRLARELTLTTIALFLGLVAAVTGVRAGAAGEPGFSLELRSGPLGAAEYTAGRIAGIALSCLVLGLALAPFVGAAELLADTPAGLRMASLGLATLAQVGSFALVGALGLALGAAGPQPLALVLVLAYGAASRILLPHLHAEAGGVGLLAHLLPDPARLDLAREVAFTKPISASSVGLATAASLLQAAALGAVAAAIFARRER